ncbi:MAG: fimbria/pilus outer membrane usher protein [Myxococcales bacterium]|nr:fimbria/pilus outer membrane usher protein [Myxococcales bacterium]
MFRTYVIILLLSFYGTAVAQPAGDQRAYLDLYLNDAAKDTVLVRLRGAQRLDDALVGIDDLEKAGLHGLHGDREMQDGREYVSLKSLAPLVTYAVDQQALTIRVTADVSLLEKTAIDLSPIQRPRDMVLRRDTSAFFNYSVTGASGAGVSGAAELGASVRGNLAYTGLTVATDGSVVRGLSNLVLDDPATLRRVTLGDAVTSASPLGGIGLLAGVSVTREFTLDPYFVRQPLPRMAGAITSPSTLDVYVNGQLVRQEQVAPGPFEVRNLPVASGAGSISYVVRDAFGRTQEFASPYYASSGVLADGVSEYGYHLGFRRAGFGTESFHYGPPEFVAHHRIGFGNVVTAGYRFESGLQHGSALASGGPSAAFALPVGELDLDGAASVDGSAAGAAGSIGWSLLTRKFTAGAVVRAMTPSYASLGQPASADRPLLQLLGSAGAPIFSVLGLTLEGQVNSMRDTGLTSSLSLRADVRLTNNLSFIVSASRFRAPGEAPEFGAFATLLYNFGAGTSADMGATASRQGPGASASVQRSLPLGEGFGYQLRSAQDPGQPTTGLGQVQYQGPYGTYLASYSRTGVTDGGIATAAGGLVLIDGNLMLSRPVQEGYALVQVPGVEGVRGYLNNQEIGRTNRGGNLLIPSLQPYYGNRLKIGDSDVPIDYEVGKVEQVIGTPLRGGALVRFDVQRVRSVTGLVRVGDRVPAYGELTVDGRASPIGGRGEFWLDHVGVGRHDARIEFGGGTCKFTLEVPEDASDLGTLSCALPLASR